MQVKTVIIIEGIADIVMMICKFVVGFMTNSSAIIGDALHSLTDLSNNLIALIALRISSKPSDEDHQYGHRKFEQLAVFLLAVLLAVVSIQLVSNAVSSFGQQVHQSQIGLWVLLLTLTINIGLTVWQHYWAKRLDSDLLYADSKHTLSDVLTTVMVIVGWQLAARGYYWLDTFFAILVAIVIFYMAFSLFQRAIPILVDHSKHSPQDLKQVVEQIDEVKQVRQIRSRNSSEGGWADVIIGVDPTMSTTMSHDITHELIESVLRDVLKELPHDSEHTHASTNVATNSEIVEDTLQLKRIDVFGSKKLSAWFAKRFILPESKVEMAEIAAMGPVGLIYLKKKVSSLQLEKISKQLVQQAHVPMALFNQGDKDVMRQVAVWRADGEFYLPEDKQHVFGRDHPFLENVCNDVIAITKHPFAGDITMLGWGNDMHALSFRVENGAHGGAGCHETHAFALLPGDTMLPDRNRPYLRFMDLHLAAKKVLGRRVDDYATAVINTSSIEKPKDSLRVMTYNVHSCIGMDGQILPKRIARVIAMYDPDIIAMQEMVVGTTDLDYTDQAMLISEQLNLDIHFHPIKEIKKGQFGNAILSKYPMRLVSARPLSTKLNRYGNKFGMAPFYQQRGALDVEIDFNGSKLRMVTTHLGLTHDERKTQIEDMISNPPFSPDNTPAILCGDLNATSKQRTHKVLSNLMDDVQTKAEIGTPIKTFPSRYPSLRIDHMFVDKKIDVTDVTVPHHYLTKVASDHLPLVVDLDLSDFITAQKKLANES